MQQLVNVNRVTGANGVIDVTLPVESVTMGFATKTRVIVRPTAKSVITVIHATWLAQVVAITTVDVTKKMGHVRAANPDIMIPFAIETVQVIVGLWKVIKGGMTVMIVMEHVMVVKRDDTEVNVGNYAEKSAWTDVTKTVAFVIIVRMVIMDENVNSGVDIASADVVIETRAIVVHNV